MDEANGPPTPPPVAPSGPADIPPIPPYSFRKAWLLAGRMVSSRYGHMLGLSVLGAGVRGGVCPECGALLGPADAGA